MFGMSLHFHGTVRFIENCSVATFCQGKGFFAKIIFLLLLEGVLQPGVVTSTIPNYQLHSPPDPFLQPSPFFLQYLKLPEVAHLFFKKLSLNVFFFS